MVSQHFKLREQPFGVTPDPKYLYASASHREALASLLYGLQSGLGFVSLIAKPGMGKTTLLFEVLRRLSDTRSTVFLFQTISSPVDLLRAILIDLGIKDVRDGLVDLQTQLNRVLLNQCAARKPVVVVIDEAQNLNDSVLETVRMLSNFETASQKLMQIVLAGQPQLAEKLMAPGLLQLRQRISIFAHLTPLSETETAGYILHRLQLAGSNTGDSIFTPSAMDLIARQSEGIPRNINNLCFNAMSLAFALRRSAIDSDIVKEVISDLSVQEHLFLAESHQFEADERMPQTASSQNDLKSSARDLGRSNISDAIDSHLPSILDPQAPCTQRPLLENSSIERGGYRSFEQVTELPFTEEPASAYSTSTYSANQFYDGPIVIERDSHPDAPFIASVSDLFSPAPIGRPEARVDTRSSQQENPNETTHLNVHPVSTPISPISTIQHQSDTPEDVTFPDRSVVPSFGMHTNWRSGLERWNHAAIAAAVVGLGLCAWLGYVDYPLLFPSAGVQASSKAVPPVASTNSGQSADPSPLAHSPALQHKGYVRVRKVESLASLCQSLYGECSPQLLEQLLAINPSLLYPNRLHPGQVISIPVDSRNAKAER